MGKRQHEDSDPVGRSFPFTIEARRVVTLTRSAGEASMTPSQHDKAVRFRALHEGPRAFIIPNPWDGASARILAAVGFQALATSSGAAAGTLGRRDGKITRQEALAHARVVV